MNKILKRIIIIGVIVVVFGSMALFFALSGKITAEIKDGKLYMNAYYITKNPGASASTRGLDLYEIEFVEKFEDEGESVDLFVSLPKVEAGRRKSSKFKEFEESGEYTIFRYKWNKSVIILTAEYSVYVINAENFEKTRDLYQKLITERDALLGK